MDKRAGLALFLYMFSSVCSGPAPSRDVIRLGFGAASGRQPSTTTPPLLPLPLNGGHKLPKNVLVFCSDAEYPNEVFCDVGMLKNHEDWNRTRGISSVELEYMYPSSKRTKCLVELDRTDKESTNFEMDSATCYPRVPDETLPTFGMSRVTWMRLDADFQPPCTAFLKTSKKQGKFWKSWSSTEGIVAFELRMLLCENSHSEGKPKSSVFGPDGRQYGLNSPA